MERQAILCFMLGYIQGKTSMKTSDALITLDNKLTEMNQVPITKEEKEILVDLKDQTEIFLIQMGVNRKLARDLGIHRKKSH